MTNRAIPFGAPVPASARRCECGAPLAYGLGAHGKGCKLAALAQILIPASRTTAISGQPRMIRSCDRRGLR